MAYSIKKDKYANARGGNSHFLDLYCSKCGNYLLLYQKDGHGSLLRLYLDRIFEPHYLAELKFKGYNRKTLPALKCSKCENLIGLPMVYEPENRLAFRLIRGTFRKNNSKGIYPPQEG